MAHTLFIQGCPWSFTCLSIEHCNVLKDIFKVTIVLFCLFQWRPSPVLEGAISINSQPNLSSETPTTTIPKCVAPVAYTARLHATVAKRFPGFSTSSCVVMDCCYALAFCRSVLGKRKHVSFCF